MMVAQELIHCIRRSTSKNALMAVKIDKEVRLLRRKPLKITQCGPSISHLCFADDSLLFGEATTSQLDIMMTVMNKFCEAYGEKISLPKEQGGLNLGDLRKSNLAFLPKLGWHFNKEALWVNLIQKKYFRHHDFLSVPGRTTDSYT